MNTAVLGMLWGDEAKAKIIQLLIPDYDMVVRFQGAANAGHTVYRSGSKIVLHAIPVGIIYEKISVIAAGCLVDPVSLIREIEEIESAGFNVFSNLKIYSNATITTDFEVELDKAREGFISGKSSKVGTTGRGIGPSYSNRAYRTAILFEDLFNDHVLLKKLEDLSMDMNPRLKTYGADEIDPKNVYARLKECATKLESLMVSPRYIGKIIEGKGNILFEGAQGALLCPINGSYPFVTSFPVNPALIPISCNIPMKYIHKIIGVLKAYPTRVGEGPFPTQIGGEKEEFLRNLGKEFGATTGRPRKCGYPDLAIAKYVVQSFGIDEIALTCLDTLCAFSQKIGNIQICENYKLPGGGFGTPQEATASYLSKVVPQYSEISLICNCSGVDSGSELPLQATNYVNLVENILGVPVQFVSTGKNIEDIIKL